MDSREKLEVASQGGALDGPEGDSWVHGVRNLRLSLKQEVLVLQLIQGKTIETAADTVGVSPDTARTYLKRVYRKLGVHSRMELAMRVFSAANHS